MSTETSEARPRSRMWWLAMAGVLALTGAACSEDDEGDDETIEVDDGADDAGDDNGDDAEDDAGDDAEEPGGGDDEPADEPADGAPENETIEEDEEAADVDWGTSATAYRGMDGTLVEYDCPAGGSAGSVWGTVVYTDDSSVCTAGVHAGLITFEEGGEVVIEIAPPEDEYTGSEANGVTTTEYGPYAGSFTFPEQ